MTNKKLNQQILSASKLFSSSIFFGMSKSEHKQEAYFSINGNLKEIVMSILSIVNDNEKYEEAEGVRDLLYNAVFTIMASDDKHAQDFFAQMENFSKKYSQGHATIIPFTPKNK